MAKTKNVIQKFTAYSDQYKSPLWQKKRLEIMNRDKFTCQECGEKEKQLNDEINPISE
jgi:5-methylcytosine-specific restriction endonuclease McrA